MTSSRRWTGLFRGRRPAGPGRRPGPVTGPRVAIVVTHPIQYFSPLFAELARRAVVAPRVIYGNDANVRPTFDKGFHRETRWDVDLLAGYDSRFLTKGPRRLGTLDLRGALTLVRLLRRNDLIIVHGYSTLLSAVSIAYAVGTRTPYLLRTDTSVLKARARWDLRGWWISGLVRSAGGG